MSVDKFKSNLEQIRHRIRAAEERSGRQAGSVRLVGVTKYVDSDVVRELVAAGCVELGENRPQSLWEKAADLKDSRIVWHLIGHLQRNKVKRTIEIASLIHSVDSDRLLEAINEAAREADRFVNVLLEVNVSGDQSKQGFGTEEIAPALRLAADCDRIRVQGLMCMAGLESTPEQTRLEFRELRQLRDSLLSSQPPNVNLQELSMGMSGDFEIAIEEGATLVRIGSLLYE